jgi:uncharacterized protein (DUF934 family)
MQKLIKDGAVVNDEWLLIGNDADAPAADLPAGEDLSGKALTEKILAGEVFAEKVIVPLPLWLANKSQLRECLPNLGVWMNGDDDVAQLAEDVAALPLIAIRFPVFTDGRGFSAGRLLRERHGFTGELRAVGNFLRDQLCYLRRCGFSAFSLNDKYDPDAALSSLNDFSEYYQPAVDQPLPLFRRRG